MVNYELTERKIVCARMHGVSEVLCQLTPVAASGALYEFKLLHNDGSHRTSVYNQDELAAIVDAIGAVLQ